MNAPISTLRVTRFRSLKDLTVGPFGRVNLITGKNNAGKSSLLEAIRILVTEGAASTFHNILNYREETGNSSPEIEQSLSPDDTSSYSSLFSGFPNLGGCSDPFTVSNQNGGDSPVKTISVRVGWFSERADPETGRRILSEEDFDLFGESIGFPALEIEAPNRKRLMRIDGQRPYRRVIAESGEGAPTPCIFLDPFSSRSTSQLAALWDSIALTDAEKQVVAALKIISPDVEAVSMIGSDSGSRSRTAIAKSAKYPNPVPLRTFGDGINRLFGIILSLSSAKGGVLLVDEIENGLHHSILTKVWEVIFQMARTLNVQVFATSHSWDCIESFQEAASADPEEGVLVRLTAIADAVVSTIFREDELKVAARNQIELR
jgi:hypothetical protein